MKQIRISRISPISLARVCGAIYFIFGVFTATLGLLAIVTGFQLTITGLFFFSGTGISYGFLLLFSPLIYAVLGYIGGYLTALVYNFVARATKGLLVEIGETDGREF